MAILVDEEKLRRIFEDIYDRGFKHGLDGQILMAPDRVFDPYIEECKKTS